VLESNGPGSSRNFDQPVIRLGRDPGNDLVLSDAGGAGISRAHAELREMPNGWRIADLNSTNGTFLNGRRVGEDALKDGDEIQLGTRGPRIRVSLPTAIGAVGGAATARTQVQSSPPPVRTPAAAVPASTAGPSDSELMPIRMGTAPLSARGYLVPAVTLVLSVIAILTAWDSGPRLAFPVTMAVFVLAWSTAFYLLCGKTRPLWPLLGAGVFVAVLITSSHGVILAPIRAAVGPYVTKQVPGPQPGTVRLVEPDTVPGKFVYHFFHAALPEELEKITPALIGLFIYLRSRRRRPSSLDEQMSVMEPLDGILFGVAGAAGFHLVEAITYSNGYLDRFAELQQNAVPIFKQLVQKYGNAAPAILMQQGLNAGVDAALQVIFRGVSSGVSHLGYSGIFGYYVGLAALHPERKGAIIARGFIIATLLHSAWNATNAVGGQFILPPVAFALLLTAIIKARALSPGRQDNFATTLGRPA